MIPWAVLLGWAIQAAVVAMAFSLARRCRAHRPIALFAVVTLVADIAHAALNLGPLDAPRPYTGALRVLFHVDQVLFNSWPVGLAAVCWIVFLRRRPWAPLAAGAVALAVLVLGYPEPFRGAALGQAYAALHAVALLASTVAVVVWVRRRAQPRSEHGAALLIGLLDFALFTGPYSPPLPKPFDDWTAAQGTYLFTWGALAVLHAASLWGGFLMDPAPPRGSVPN